MAVSTQIALVDIPRLLDHLTRLCKERYGKRLISLAVFGSMGRGTPRPDSDLDILLVIQDLPVGRVARMGEFAAIETALGIAANNQIELSPVLKTPEKIAQGSPLLLDMVEDARILFDRDDYFKNVLENLKARLQ